MVIDGLYTQLTDLNKKLAELRLITSILIVVIESLALLGNVAGIQVLLSFPQKDHVMS